MNDVPVAADQDIGRDLGHAVRCRIVFCSGAIDQIRPADVVVDEELLDVGHVGLELGILPLKGVEVDAQNTKALGLVRGINPIEPRDLYRARDAPACPEYDEHDITLERGQVDWLTVQVRSLDGRSGFANHLELVEPGGTEALYGGIFRFFEQELKGVLGDVEPVSLEQPLVVRLAD